MGDEVGVVCDGGGGLVLLGRGKCGVMFYSGVDGLFDARLRRGFSDAPLRRGTVAVWSL